ncbi:MAG TPA: GreA/GreB family elongation factor [Polyangiaceae bacterium]
MSRAFVKEDTLAAPLVPHRAPLPAGARNYVTRRGLASLRAELEGLVAELVGAPSRGEVEAATLRQRIAELEERLSTAELVDSAQGTTAVVRFGARVTVRAADGSERTFRIVGVDEANASEGRVAFVAPLARAVLGKSSGDVVVARTPRADEELEIVALDFAPET